MLRSEGCACYAVVEVCLRRERHEMHLRLEQPEPLTDILVTAVADMLSDLLQEPQASPAFNPSTCGVSVPGLDLSGLRLMTSAVNDGSARATAWFLRATGDPAAILTDRLRGPAPVWAGIEQTALPVLQDLLCPALAIFDHVLEHGLSEPDARVLAARLKTMRSRRDELYDYIELLTRALRSGAGHPAGLASHPPLHGDRIAPQAPHGLAARSVSWSPTGGTVRGEQASILHGHHAGAQPN